MRRLGRAGDPANRPGERVLVVDPDPSVRHLAERVLAAGGYRLTTAAGVAEARAVVEEEPGDLDLLLVDLTLPGSSGPELARHARSLHPELKVLYLSAYSARALRRAELSHPFLAKPLRSEELLRAVEGILDDTRVGWTGGGGGPGGAR